MNWAKNLCVSISVYYSEVVVDSGLMFFSIFCANLNIECLIRLLVCPSQGLNPHFCSCRNLFNFKSVVAWDCNGGGLWLTQVLHVQCVYSPFLPTSLKCLLASFWTNSRIFQKLEMPNPQFQQRSWEYELHTSFLQSRNTLSSVSANWLILRNSKTITHLFCKYQPNYHSLSFTYKLK